MFRHRINFKSNTRIAITQEGNKLASDYSSRGALFVIASKLAERSPMSVGDLADETGMDIGELKHYLEKMHPVYIRAMDE